MNTMKVIILLASLSGLLLVVGYFIARGKGVVIALIIALVMNFGGYWYSDRIVLAMYDAKPVTRAEAPLLYDAVESLSARAKIPVPKVYVIPSGSPNAFATGRDPDHAVVCATTGLLSKLNRTELEGVLAHEISHIRNYDIRLMSVVSVMVGLVALLGDWFFRISYFGRGSRDRDNGNIGAMFLVLGIIFAILSPIIAQLIQLAISRRREFTADAGSVEITRQPQGLISALQKISEDTEPLEAANKATAHLYIVNPFHSVPDKGQRAVNFMAGLFNTHPPMPERINALQNMT